MEGIVAGERGIVVAPHGEGSAGIVIEEVQAADKGPGAGVGYVVPDDAAVLGHVFMPFVIGNLYAPHAGHVVLVAVGLIALLDAAQSAALGPAQVAILRAVVPNLQVTTTPALLSYTLFASLSRRVVRRSRVRMCQVLIGKIVSDEARADKMQLSRKRNAHWYSKAHRKAAALS